MGILMPRNLYRSGKRIKQVGVGNTQLITGRPPINDPVHGVELADVLIVRVDILKERFEAGAARKANIQRLCRHEALQVEKVVVVLVDNFGQKRLAQPIKRRELGQRKIPSLVAWSVDMWRVK